MEDHTAIAPPISHGLDSQSCQPSGNPDVSSLVAVASQHFDYTLQANRSIGVNFDSTQSSDLTYLVTDPVTYAYINAQDGQVQDNSPGLGLCQSVASPAITDSHCASSSAGILSAASSLASHHQQQKLTPHVQYSLEAPSDREPGASCEQLFRLSVSAGVDESSLSLSSPSPLIIDQPRHLHAAPLDTQLPADSHQHLVSPSIGQSTSQCLLCGCLLSSLHEKSAPPAISLHATHVRGGRLSLAAKLLQLFHADSSLSPMALEQLLGQLQQPGQLVSCHSCAVLVSAIDELEVKLSQLRRNLLTARGELFQKVAAHRSVAGENRGIGEQVSGEMVGSAQVAEEHCGTVILGGVTTVPGIDIANNNTIEKVKSNAEGCGGVSTGLGDHQLNNARPRFNMSLLEKIDGSELGLVSDTGAAPYRNASDICVRSPTEEVNSGDGAVWRSLKQPQYITAHFPVRCLLCNRVLLDRLSQQLHQIMHTTQTEPPSGGSVNQSPQTLCPDNLVPLVADDENCKTRTPDGDTGVGIAVTVYKCDICGALYANRDALHVHHSRAHRSLGSDGVDSLRCPLCWRVVEDADLLAEHMSSHGEENCCRLCGQHFSSRQTLTSHVTRSHRLATGNSCELCMAGFISELALAQHAELVHGLVAESGGQVAPATDNTTEPPPPPSTKSSPHRPFSCPECARRFASKQARACHVRAFHRHNPFTCSRCGRRCESPSALARHARSHAGVASFQCSVCNKRLTTEYSLKVHMRAIHVGELPYRCQLCDKTFAYKSSLTMHAATHSSRKAFVCDVCGKCFSSRSSLRTHQHAHSERKPHACQWCERSFARRDLLARHQLQSHGVQPTVAYSRITARTGTTLAKHTAAAKESRGGGV